MGKGISLWYQINNCNQRCRHCYAYESAPVRRSPEEIKCFLRQAAGLLNDVRYGSVEVLFHHEPTIYKEIKEVLESCEKEGLSFLFPGLMTNCSGLVRRKGGKEILRQYKKMGITRIGVSLFGLEAYHDAFTGRKGSYNDIIQAIELFKKEGLEYGVNLFVTDENREDVKILKKQYGALADFVVASGCQKMEENQKQYHIRPTKKTAALLGMLDQNGTLTLKSQQDWVKMIQSKTDMSSYYTCDDEMFFLENGNKLYSSVYIKKHHLTGDLSRESLQDIVKRKSLADYISDHYYNNKNNFIQRLCQQWGDTSDETVYYFWDLLTIWSEKEFDHHAHEYLEHLEITDCVLFPENDVSCHYEREKSSLKVRLYDQKIEIDGEGAEFAELIFENKQTNREILSRIKKQESALTIHKKIKEYQKLIKALYHHGMLAVAFEWEKA